MTARPTGPRRGPVDRLRAAVGGGEYLKHIVLLSAALALAAADQTIVGAVAPDLKLHLRISNTQIGLLVTVASLMAAASTLPFGLLADRTHRIRMLAICSVEWSVAITVAGFADNYGVLLAAQLALGAGVGAAGPIVASLVGDLFPAGMRGQALGFIVAGEFAGAASGLLIAGELAAVWSWRGSFWTLAIFGPVLAVALLVLQPEPARGAQRETNQKRTPQRTGENDVIPGEQGDTTVAGAEKASGATHAAATPAGRGGLAASVRDGNIQPRPKQILDADPARKSMGWAIRHVLSIPTNVVIIISSSLAYFYVAGVQAFAIVYLRGKFDLSQELATVLLVVIGAGVIVGILATGRTSDTLITRGHGTARPLVGGLSFLAAVVLFLPGFSTGSLLLAIPLLFLGAAALGGVNPPLDAARLDVVHSRLWGRAEAIRTFCQNLIKAGSPLLFGWLSTVLGDGGGSGGVGGGVAGGGGVGGGVAGGGVDVPQGGGVAGGGVDVPQGGGAVGLNNAFLLLLAVFVLAGVVLLIFRRGYLRDVATAMASEERVAEAARRG